MFKSGGEGWGENFEEINANVRNAISKLIYTSNFILIEQKEINCSNPRRGGGGRSEGRGGEIQGGGAQGIFEDPEMNLYSKFNQN